jgi:DNA-binding CsgD family transcriptional regulator
MKTKQGRLTLMGNTDESVFLGMEGLGALQSRYMELLGRQQFVVEDLDYGKVDAYRSTLEHLAAIKNSGISVFDLHQKEHVFASYNFEALFGYDNARIAAEGSAYFDARIHPDDHVQLMAIGVEMIAFLLGTPATQVMDYKLVNEYRILNREGNYVRIVEQHQALELDRHGHVWLTLSVVDLSPRQGVDLGVESTLINFRTGEMVNPLSENIAGAVRLTAREREVLQLIQKGLLSKEISEVLSISVHTVNTHRQRILEKLNAGNSMEAVQLASRLGLLGGN